MSKRVVIVGAGPGGLASAMLLASAGLDVTILERRDRPGGRTSGFELADADAPSNRYQFDLGPTFFLYPAVLKQVFKIAGFDLDREVEMVRLDPQYRLMFEDPAGGTPQRIDATPDVKRMQSEIAKLSPGDAERFPGWLADNRVKFAKFKPILQRPFDSMRDMVGMDTIKSGPWVRPWASVDSDLKHWFKDPRVRLAFSFQSKYLGMSPFKCPSLFTILSFLEYEYGVYHPTGGCHAVSEKMAALAESMGVTIRYSSEVSGFDFEGKRPKAAIVGDERYEADAVMINADFAHAMRKLVPDALRKRWTDRSIAKKKYSCSTYMIYAGVDRRFDDLAHHTIFLSKDYERNLREIETDHVLSENPSVYVHNPVTTDPSMAPDGHSSLYILAPVTHETAGVDWKRDGPAFRAKVLEQVRKLGLPDLEPHIRAERTVSPEDWRDDLAIFRGATFNLAHGLDQMLCFRPRNRFEDLDATYLTGGGTHPGSGLPVIYESALISSRLLLSDLGIGVTDAWDADRSPLDDVPLPGMRPRPADVSGDNDRVAPTPAPTPAAAAVAEPVHAG
ncbi:MAG: phytoene desaturase family protein [Planctomycetota bacterium]